jgi:four helix bundle protein
VRRARNQDAAKVSAAEVQSLLYVAMDRDYVRDMEFSTLYAKTDEVARILSGFITSLLRRSARSGTQ